MNLETQIITWEYRYQIGNKYQLGNITINLAATFLTLLENQRIMLEKLRFQIKNYVSKLIPIF